jgi:enamine deaminase RidA (YjgF/YER057c/UK114 family)
VDDLVRHLTTPAWKGYADIFSDGVEVPPGARLLVTAGQNPIRADGSVPVGWAAQCEQALLNLVAVLEAGGMTPSDVVKLTCYVVGDQDRETLYDARRRLLPGAAPAATVIGIAALAPGHLLEVEAIAAAP